jgi:hypothetical protein
MAISDNIVWLAKQIFVLYKYNNSLVWSPGQNKRVAPLPIFHECLKRQLKDKKELPLRWTAVRQRWASPYVTSAVYLLAKYFW